MRQADAEVSRDNAAMLFVTAFIGVLDLESGELEYCNAGHDDPYALAPDGAAPARLAGGDGPPLCAVDGYAYRGATHRLQPGELLCLVTDGVAEARDAAGALYGSERLRSALARLDARTTTAQAAVEALRADVAAFVGDAEPADDLTVLALRWLGPGRR
jgi:serine phosphatase RsbU (regulator of sigma subunit)